ncbi:hypothetical protein BANRA_02693 [Escherichia coli]|nr:hypothetical protein BANRA_02693 [Escherichia coli]
MKTKIAEALSYGLYVIANTRSTCGYETAIEAGVISCVNDATFIIDATSEIVDCFSREDKDIIYKSLHVLMKL